MNMKRYVLFFLVFVLLGRIQMQAQQSNAGPPEFRATKTKAEAGDVVAQNNLGVIYDRGEGVEKNAVEAMKWYLRAAEQGYAVAQCNVAGMYYQGDGVTKDFAAAGKWYRKAAEQGYALAEYCIGLQYGQGEGEKKDSLEAVKWFKKAADHGLADAQRDLGLAYELGNGVEKDFATSIKWYRKAAQQGNAQAANDIGIMYSAGNGVEKDVKEAMNWYRKAAEQNDASGQYNLAMCYAKGNGVPKDYIAAYKWFNLAAAQGDENAKKGLVISESIMTSPEISEGQRLSREFVPRKGSTRLDAFDLISPTSPSFSGTGFFITENGFLISNYHVVKDAAKVRLLTGAGLIDTKVVKVDVANDLALLKAVGQFVPLPIAASRTVKLGGTVATVGFPDIGLQGFAPKLAKGEIASLSGAADDPRYFQISLPVQPGNSGGALVDAHGNVVGIVAAKLDASVALAATGSLPENVNYAVKSSLLLSFLESVPEVSAKLKEPITKDEAFEEVVKSAQDAAVLVLVY